MSIRIVTDSTCDLPAETISRYGIQVIPLYINVGTQGFRDGIDITREDFYAKLPTFSQHPTTAAPSIQKFQEIYDSLASEGASEIISIHISISLSGLINVAQVAAKATTSARVTVVDSEQLSLGTGFLVETAAKMAQTGHTLAEIMLVLNSQIQRSHVFAAIETLEFLKRSGRMNRFVANLGALFQIKPILTMHVGKPGTERVRTSERAMQRLLEMLRRVGPFERVAILHTNALERVAELKIRAAEFLPVNDLLIADITPVIGVHIGPGAYGFAILSASS